MHTKARDTLLEISIPIGKRADYVQGGGGNTSVKYGRNQMIIKASGVTLNALTQLSGWTRVDTQTFLPHAEDLRPSMETSFHAYLGRVIIHTHSVYANILTCSETGESLVKQYFSDAFWIDYATPGQPLTDKIKEKINSEMTKTELIIFLKNHGIIVSARSAKRALELHEMVTTVIQEKLNFPNFDQFHEVSEHEITDPKQVLFPDQIVYTLSGSELMSTQAGIETQKAYHYIATTIMKNNLVPTFLNASDVAEIANLESEKYRKKMVKNDLY